MGLGAWGGGSISHADDPQGPRAQGRWAKGSADLCNLAFSLSSCGTCATSQLLHEPSQRMPRALWRALDGPEGLAEIRKFRPCQHSAFSSAFIAAFGGVQELGNTAAKVVLWQIERVHRNEIVNLECRNAAIRRVTRKSQTWNAEFQQAHVANGQLICPLVCSRLLDFGRLFARLRPQDSFGAQALPWQATQDRIPRLLRGWHIV